MVFNETNMKLTESDIIEVEKSIRVGFPDEFKSHYLEFNGGYPERRYYKWDNDEGFTRINSFLAMKYDQFGTLENGYKNLSLLEAVVPIGIIQFAMDDFGNSFSISAREKDYGYIYYYDNDKYDTQDKEACLIFLCKRFNDFLNCLVDTN